MGSSLLKDISDAEALHNNKGILDSIQQKWNDLPGGIGPVKLDALDYLARTYARYIPFIEQRVGALEEHLTKGAAEGRSFIRPQERPDVGADAVNSLVEQVRKLNERLEHLEGRI